MYETGTSRITWEGKGEKVKPLYTKTSEPEWNPEYNEARETLHDKITRRFILQQARHQALTPSDFL